MRRAEHEGSESETDGESVVQNKVRVMQGCCPADQTTTQRLPSSFPQPANAAIVPMQLFGGPECELNRWSNSG